MPSPPKKTHQYNRLISSGLFFATSIWALTTHAATLESLSNLLPEGSQVALSVYDLTTKQTLLSQQTDALVPPASTQKILTALAASLYLPKNFTFKTSIHTINKDLIIKFDGDPTLTRKDLQSIVSKLKQRGVTTIKGDIWLDKSVFSGQKNATGLPWDILGVCYSAPSTAITLDKNCVQGSIYSNRSQTLTRVFVPSYQAITVQSTARAISKEQQKAEFCDLELTYNDNNQYQLSGCLAYREKPLPLNIAIQNPAKFFAETLVQELERANIKLQGKIRLAQNQINVTTPALITHSSNHRDALIKEMLVESDNLLADNLLKTMGGRFYNTAGSYGNGVAAAKTIIQQKTGIDLTSSKIVDGSGLSRNNRMTAAQLMTILQWIQAHPETNLLNLFPVAGVTGTLQYRPSMRQPPLKNNLRAKSGSLYGASNLVGTMKTKQGNQLLFVQLVSNYFKPEGDDQPKYDTPIVRFEKALYRELYNGTLTQ